MQSDVELAEALNGYSISFAYHSGKIENGRVTYHDVREIFDTKGSLVARYIYDTWGNTLSVTDANGKAITDANHIANINPIRYRGYYYDAETGLDYLQSRYYEFKYEGNWEKNICQTKEVRDKAKYFGRKTGYFKQSYVWNLKRKGNSQCRVICENL